MGARIIWLGVVPGRRRDGRPRCHYCARVLRAAASNPDEARPHCPAAGCRVCGECADGLTPVSPTRRR